MPTLELNSEEFRRSLLDIVGDDEPSKALVCLPPEAAYIPMPKLKDIGRLRTVHYVYEILDSHPILQGFEKREPDDPCPYLFAIWISTPDDATPCSQEATTACKQVVELEDKSVVGGMIFIPCRTAQRGRFPLNGAYFQVNEVFADHETSLNPISIPRAWIWNLSRRALYCGTSATSICRSYSEQKIAYIFRRGFICIRGMDRRNRALRPLGTRFHQAGR